MSHHVKIRLNGAGSGTVEVDGKPLSVRFVQVQASVGKPTTVLLELIGCDIDLESTDHYERVTINGRAYFDATALGDESRSWKPA